MRERPVNKIVKGLEAAVAFANCDHDWIVKDISEHPSGYIKVKSRCDWCGTVQHKFLPQGSVEFVKVEVETQS